MSAPPAIPLQWVHRFKYLGIVISRLVKDYMQLNLLSMLAVVKARLEAWENLPLSLLGRINLGHSTLNQLLVSFLWDPLSTLIRPVSQGGLSVWDRPLVVMP